MTDIEEIHKKDSKTEIFRPVGLNMFEPTNCLSVFDHFVGLAVKRLISDMLGIKRRAKNGSKGYH